MPEVRPVAPVAVVLAAGKGTRMRSSLPKVLHSAAGRPLLGWVLEAARGAGCERILVIVGHQSDRVRVELAADDVTWVEQSEQRGTGHALAQVEEAVAGAARLLVLSGDVPLVSSTTLRRLAATAAWGAMAVADLATPGSLGRVVAESGRLRRIVEAADAAPEELRLPTVNAGIYALPAPEIFGYLAALEPDNAKGEHYLTDALNDAVAAGEAIELVQLADTNEALGVNSRGDLARVGRELRRRKADELLAAGVTLVDPDSAVVDPDVQVAADSVVHHDVSLLGTTRVGSGSVLHRGVWLRDTRVGDGTEILPYSVLDGAEIGDGCRVGPFARLRPGAVLGRAAQVGNFVEVKNSELGEGAKANHLAYVGDTTVGERANLGAGTVTCNYDGYEKHRTEIGRGARIGSDTMLVAPIKVGDDAVTGAGSVITKNVPDGALAVERSDQRNVPGWSERDRRRRKK